MKWNFAYYNVYALTKRYIRTLLAFNSLSLFSNKKNSLFCFSFFLFLKNKNKNKNLFFFNYKCTLTCTFTLFFINIINMHFTTIYYPLLLFRRYLCWWAREGTIWSPANDTRNHCRWRDQIEEKEPSDYPATGTKNSVHDQKKQKYPENYRTCVNFLQLFWTTVSVGV